MHVTELLLKIEVPGVLALPPYNAWSIADLGRHLTDMCSDDNSRIFVTGSAVVESLIEAIPILVKLKVKLRFLDLGTCMGKPLLTIKLVFLSLSVRHPNKEPVGDFPQRSGGFRPVPDRLYPVFVMRKINSGKSVLSTT